MGILRKTDQEETEDSAAAIEEGTFEEVEAVWWFAFCDSSLWFVLPLIKELLLDVSRGNTLLHKTV